MSKNIILNKLNHSNYFKKNYNHTNDKLIYDNPVFSPILEESGDLTNINKNKNLNIASITNNVSSNNIYLNNSFFERNNYHGINSGENKTINKYHPSLNLACLPTVFEIPNENNNKKIDYSININKNYKNYEDSNINLKFSGLNLKPIINNDKFKFNNSETNNNENKPTNNSHIINVLPPIINHSFYKKQSKNNSKEHNNEIKEKMKKVKLMRNIPYNKTLLSLNYFKINNYELIQDEDSNYNINLNEGLISFFNKDKKSINNITQNNKFDNNIKSFKISSKSPESFNKTVEKYHNLVNNKKNETNYIVNDKEYIHRNSINNINLMKKSISTKKINNKLNIYKPNKNEFMSINKSKTKVLHIPSLKIYNRYDIKIKDFNENYINNWKKLQKKVNIKYIFENEKINCYHIIVEKNKNGSLLNILKNFGSLNENILKKLINQIINIIIDYNKVFKNRYNNPEEMIYNYIGIDNLWINEQFDIVLFPSKLKKKIEENKNINEFLTEFFDINNKNNHIDQTNYNDNQLKIDLMNFGMTLININIFSLGLTINDLFELAKQKNEEEKKIENKNINHYYHNYCCLFHYFFKNIKIFSDLYDTLKSMNEYTENYFNFLHEITSFLNNDKKDIIGIIKENEYIKDNKNDITLFLKYSNLIELVETGKKYNLSNEYYGSISDVENFDNILQKIKNKINFCKPYIEYHHINDLNSFILFNNINLNEIASELFITYDDLTKKLIPIYKEIFD